MAITALMIGGTHHGEILQFKKADEVVELDPVAGGNDSAWGKEEYHRFVGDPNSETHIYRSSNMELGAVVRSVVKTWQRMQDALRKPKT